MSYQCEMREQPTQATLAIRTRVSIQGLPQVMAETWGAISQYLGESGEQPAGPPFAIYYNQDMQDMDVEIGFPVSKKLPGKGDIQAGELPGGRVATCLHIGPYAEVGAAHGALSQFVAEHGYETVGVTYSTYLNNPEETPAEELQTQIAYPLK